MKKKHIIIFAFAIAALVLSSCKKENAGGFPPIEGENFDKDASYAIGMNVAASLAADGIIPNLNEFILGMRDYLSGGNTRFNETVAVEKIQTAYFAIMEQMEAEAMREMEQLGAEALQEGIDFLVQNSRMPGIKITSSGLQYEVIAEGNGPKPSASDLVRVHYEGRLVNGMIFDSSYSRGAPAEFILNEVISGWTEGVQLMSVGSTYRFFIPQELGYGYRAAGSIPPYSTLIFEVELLDIIK